MRVQAVILAAGMGSRLGRALPKPLTLLADGRTILQQQVENVRAVFGTRARVTLVVGYKLEHVIDSQPDAEYVYNERYDQSNTAKSLLRALRESGPGGVLWLNGDVVFDPAILARVEPLIEADTSFVCVNTASVSDEEVKYRVDDDGFVCELSKTVRDGLGEAVGINFVSGREKSTLIGWLERAHANDYFERGMELAIAAGQLRVSPVDVSDLYAVEVDFAEDLEHANTHLRARAG
ncbi:MAG TPA: phosphocholine cytidylyltransferase family protein [Microbacteriaceae bacterium]|nr:phosphocholine cytidylyltransferase family protein [Microbacteriaceae bacterium]